MALLGGNRGVPRFLFTPANQIRDRFENYVWLSLIFINQLLLLLEVNIFEGLGIFISNNKRASNENILFCLSTKSISGIFLV